MAGKEYFYKLDATGQHIIFGNARREAKTNKQGQSLDTIIYKIRCAKYKSHLPQYSAHFAYFWQRKQKTQFNYSIIRYDGAEH